MSVHTNQLGTSTFYGKSALASAMHTALLAAGGNMVFDIGMRLQHTENTTTYGLLDIGDSNSGAWDGLCNIQKVNGGSQIRSYFNNTGTAFATAAYPTWTASTWRTQFFRVTCIQSTGIKIDRREVWQGTYIVNPTYTLQATQIVKGGVFDAAWLGTQRFGTASAFNTFSNWKIAEMCVWGGSGLTTPNHKLATGFGGATPYSFALVQPDDIIDYSSFRMGLDGSGWTALGTDTEDLPEDNPELIWTLNTSRLRRKLSLRNSRGGLRGSRLRRLPLAA